ncbi:thiol:disulfide interchange protein TlpA [Ancylobacter sp. G4_0304]|uniref:thiol:disulfide interchange protein TlpA n=1 Tax=Ancylobacter sp. G4_0304 TaxID=3114289 RepID=UPI0039C5DE66
MTERSQDNPEDRPGPRDGAGRARRGRLVLLVAGALVLGAAAGLAGVYGINGAPRNADAGASDVADAPAPVATAPDAAQCKAASETARRISALATGELAAFAPTLTPTRIPDLAFLDPEGKPLRLADTGGKGDGKGLRLVNIWATWCVPCRTEMPALDELEGTLGGKDFSVVAINIDTRDPEKPRKFMAETGIKHLALYTDPKAAAFQELRTVGRGFGLPTTMLIDGNGCEIGHIAGPAEWASPDAVKLIRAALAPEGAAP